MENNNLIIAPPSGDNLCKAITALSGAFTTIALIYGAIQAIKSNKSMTIKNGQNEFSIK